MEIIEIYYAGLNERTLRIRHVERQRGPANAAQWLHILCANLQLNGALMQQKQQQQQVQQKQRQQQMASCIAMVSSHTQLSLPLPFLPLSCNNVMT